MCGCNWVYVTNLKFQVVRGMIWVGMVGNETLVRQGESLEKL